MENNKAKSLLKKAMENSGYNLTKLAAELSDITGENVSVQNISNKLNRGTIKMNEVESMLNIMGYELYFKENSLLNMPTKVYPILMNCLAQDELSTVMHMILSDTVPNKIKMEFRNRLYHSKQEDIRQCVSRFLADASYHISIRDYI